MCDLLVLAAGMGSRFGGLKQVEPVGPTGETLLDYSVYDALETGFASVTFVIRHDFAEDFRARVGGKFGGNVRFAYQEIGDLPVGFTAPVDRIKPWGTGHAVLAARDVVDGPFVVINADDFYGRASYKLLSSHLAASEDAAMAGYQLGGTLSTHGTVSRGVCHVDPSGRLAGITEYRKISRGPEGIRDKETGQDFSGDELVSLNFWGLQHGSFAGLEIAFSEFLENGGLDSTREFGIPGGIEWLMQHQGMNVRVLPTSAPWFGVTYKEDAPEVRARIARLVGEGEYRSPLWKI